MHVNVEHTYWTDETRMDLGPFDQKLHKSQQSSTTFTKTAAKKRALLKILQNSPKNISGRFSF